MSLDDDPLSKDLNVSRLFIFGFLNCDSVIYLLLATITTVKLYTIGGDRMVEPLGKVNSPFRPTSCKRSGDRTTTLVRRLRNPLQELPHLLLDCPTSEPLWRAFFHTTSSIFDVCPRSWGVTRLLSLHGVPTRPHPSEGVG